MNDADRLDLPRIPGLATWHLDYEFGFRHYDRRGEKISFEDWGRLREYGGLEYLRVARDEIGEYTVSTVWLGIDHSFGGSVPLIFETMVFHDDETDVDEMRRYATEEQALEGHAEIVHRVQLLVDATSM